MGQGIYRNYRYIGGTRSGVGNGYRNVVCSNMSITKLYSLVVYWWVKVYIGAKSGGGY